MSTRSYLRRKAPQTLSFLLPLLLMPLLLMPLLLMPLLLMTGCGLTGRNYLADDAGPEATIDVVVDDLPKDDVLSSDSSDDEAASSATTRQVAAAAAQPLTGSPAADPLNAREPADTSEVNHVTRRGPFRLPDEATIDMPPMPLGPVMPVSSRANLLKGAPLIEAPPIPEMDEQDPDEQDPAVADTTLPPALPQGAAATQLAPPTPRTVDKVSTENFQQEVLESDIPVLVDFYADTCGPCKLLAPMLDQVAREQDGLRIVKVNIDHDKQLAQRYRVRSVPTIMIFNEGKMVIRETGLQTIQRSLGR